MKSSKASLASWPCQHHISVVTWTAVSGASDNRGEFRRGEMLSAYGGSTADRRSARQSGDDDGTRRKVSLQDKGIDFHSDICEKLRSLTQLYIKTTYRHDHGNLQDK